MAGMVHYITHPTTGSTKQVCYLQDVFVDPAHRKKGIARQLVIALAHLGKEEDWQRIYWIAENDNVAAQNLYKSIGVRLDFSFHVLPLDML